MNLSPALFLILGVLFWSGNYVLGRAVVGTVPPITLAYIRWILAFLLFLPFAWDEVKANREKISPNWKAFVIMGITGVLGFNYFQYLAVKYTTAINATIINASLPMFTALTGYVFFRNKLNKYQITGIVCSMFGVLVVITRGELANLLRLVFNRGDLFMLIAVLINTAYLQYVRRKGFLVPQRALFLCSLLGGLIATLPAPLLELQLVGTEWMSRLGTAHFISLLYFAIFPSILSMLFFNRAIVELGPVKTSIYLNLSIVFSSVLGKLFLQEELLLTHLVGGLLIVTGVMLTNKQETAKESQEPRGAGA